MNANDLAVAICNCKLDGLHKEVADMLRQQHAEIDALKNKIDLLTRDKGFYKDLALGYEERLEKKQ